MEPIEKGSDTPTSTPSTEQGETSGLTDTAQSKPAPLPWTLQRLNRTWCLCEDGVVRLEKKALDGANDEQWRSIIRTTGVHIKNDPSTRTWGPLARRDFLNFLEIEHPDRMIRVFDSREAAEIEQENRKKISISNENE